MSHQAESLSRTISHALRHEPWRYGLKLDAEGWTSIDQLVAALARDYRWRDLGRDDVIDTVGKLPKRRHEVDGDWIRALYGHSTPVEL